MDLQYALGPILQVGILFNNAVDEWVLYLPHDRFILTQEIIKVFLADDHDCNYHGRLTTFLLALQGPINSSGLNALAMSMSSSMHPSPSFLHIYT